MKFIHPLAIVGLITNASILWFLFSAISNADMSALSAEEQEVLYMVSSIKSFLAIVVIMQVVALLMLEFRAPGGLILAFIAAFFTMPIGIIYLLGCLFTQNNVRFSIFMQQKTPTITKSRAKFPSSQTKSLGITAAICIGLGVLAYLNQMVDFAAVGICSGLAVLYMTKRTISMPPLVFYDDYLAVVPVVTANPVILPYKDIQKATLLPDESIIFTVTTPNGNKSLHWKLVQVEKQRRREALELMADVLRAHHVVLE